MLKLTSAALAGLEMPRTRRAAMIVVVVNFMLI